MAPSRSESLHLATSRVVCGSPNKTTTDISCREMGWDHCMIM
jgi:hypothetical protein